MQKIELHYNPYKMETILLVDGVNVETMENYQKFQEFIKTGTPLQTWIEPISYKNWKGLINGLVEDDHKDALEIHFYGREIDFEDLKRACECENCKRKNPLDLSYIWEEKLFDKKLAQNIEFVMRKLDSDEFAKIVEERKDAVLEAVYSELPNNYKEAKEKEFKVVVAGMYSSGKSTLLNTLIRHEILPTSSKSCTAKACRICHDGMLKGNEITLECFDESGEIVVQKERFDSDDSCYTRLLEITPIGELKSNPESVETIELTLNLSHLYPSQEMEKEFKLVIVDTPGSNSSKTEGKEVKPDIQIALDAITNGSKEMVIICADGNYRDDTSIGVFLKAIYKSNQEDNGDFNDRFLFILNKCDGIIFNPNEQMNDIKENFARYITNMEVTKGEKISEFIPRIFLTCAYVNFAIQKKAFNFTGAELDNDEKGIYLKESYKSFKNKIIEYKMEKFFLANYCDIPEYRRQEFDKQFNEFLDSGKESEAVAIQTGICCIESAIKDYIERYAYPFKVRNLLETFDFLLDDIAGFIDNQTKVLKDNESILRKGMSERELKEKEKKEEEERKNKLKLLDEKVKETKEEITEICFDRSELNNICQILELETDKFINSEGLREQDRTFTREEIRELIKKLDGFLSEQWEKMTSEYENCTNKYKIKLRNICKLLKDFAVDLQKDDQIQIGGYNFSNSIGLQRINRLDIYSLQEQVEDKKKIVKKKRNISFQNPIKNESYSWWQFGKKIKQILAPELISKTVEEDVVVYCVEPLVKYLGSIRSQVDDFCQKTDKEYTADIDKIKKQALNMADDVKQNIESASQSIEEYKEKIRTYKNDEEALKKEIEEVQRRRLWLLELSDGIKGGQYV